MDSLAATVDDELEWVQGNERLGAELTADGHPLHRSTATVTLDPCRTATPRPPLAQRHGARARSPTRRPI